MQKAINTSLQQDCNTLRVRLDGFRARLNYLEARLEAVDLRLSSCMAPSPDMAVKTTPLPPHINQFTSPAMAELRAASAEARPAGLVEQVSKRIEFGIDANQDPEGITRAAIREIATAARDAELIAAATWLELEADK